jgi:sugar lactone lactonase YvrE
MITRKAKPVAVLLGLWGLMTALLPGQYKVRTENGVTVVTNGRKPDPPKGAPTRLVLEELYTVGGGDSPEASFVQPSALDVLPDGTVYVVDSKDHKVKVFDADGRYIARVPIVHDIQLWRDGKAYFFVEDEDGYRVLRCCRARWER